MQNDENVIVTENQESNEVSTLDLINNVKNTNDTLKAELAASKKREAELAKALLNNESIQDSQPVDLRSAKEIAEEFFQAAERDDRRRGFELALEYREARIRESGVDPFVQNNPQNPPSAADFMEADRYADAYRQILDNTDDNAGFNIEYNRVFTDKK